MIACLAVSTQLLVAPPFLVAYCLVGEAALVVGFSLPTVSERASV